MKTNKFLFAAVVLGISILLNSCMVGYDDGWRHPRHRHYHDRESRDRYNGAYRY